MTTPAPTHFVFVDFENVPAVDLKLIAGKPVHVTLLIGKTQTKLDFALVDQIHQQAAQVELVKLEASGRNALDLTLAFYLGRTVERAAAAQFHIVSKDKDFEPMISHLAGKGVKVVRCDSFAALPFLPKPKKSPPVKTVGSVKASPPTKTVVDLKVPAPDERLEKLINRLRNDLAPRPKKKTSLLAHINTAYGGKLTETEQNLKLAELIKQGVLSFAPSGEVTYQEFVF